MLGIKENTSTVETNHVVADDWSANWNGSVAIKITALVVWIVIAYSFVIAIILLNKTTSELEEKMGSQARHVAHEFAIHNYHPDNNSNLGELERIIINRGFLAARILYKDEEKWIGKILSHKKTKELPSIAQPLLMHASASPEATLELFHRPYKQLAQGEKIQSLVTIVLSILGFGFMHVYITSRVLKRPFQAIEEASQRVINGDLTIRMDARRQDEFGRLATFFNNMLDRIQSDNTELKETLEHLQATQNKLIKSQQDANAANEAKSLFLANMSHEIRTPMNAILGYTQILQCDKTLEDNQQTSIEAIGRSGNHLLDLINNVLDISKIEAGRMELNRVDFYINNLIQDLSEMFRLNCQKNQIEWNISTNIKSEVLAVHGDEGKLRQVLINLLSNAVKFTSNGGVTLSLKKTPGNQFVFEVIDTGPGIPENSLNKIFEIFQQDEQGIKKGGSGLGLAISKKQIGLMGGTLKVESIPGKGSRFYFSIHLPPATNKMPENIAKKTIPKLVAGTHIKALVVDDIPENRDVMYTILTETGIETQKADDGPSSITIARDFQPDIIFMDYHMPGMSGLDAISRIKEHAKKPFLAIMVTASSFEVNQRQFNESRIARIITKPFTIEDIISCLSMFLGASFVDDEHSVIAGKKSIANNPVELTSIKVPAEIIGQLKDAAEFNLVTDLERISSRLHQLGDEYLPLSKRLQYLIRKFDLTEIRNLADGLSSE